LINLDKIPASLLARWGSSLLRNGWTTIPNGLLIHQKDLDLSNSEMMLLIHMISFMHHPDTPIFPSISTLAKRINQHERTVQRTIDKLLKKKLINKKIRSKSPLDKGLTNLYSLDPLIEKLILLHTAEQIKNEEPMKNNDQNAAAVNAIMSLRSQTSSGTSSKPSATLAAMQQSTPLCRSARRPHPQPSSKPSATLVEIGINSPCKMVVLCI